MYTGLSLNCGLFTWLLLSQLNIILYICRAVNAGKSILNEDQACIHRGLLTRPERSTEPQRAPSLPYVYFGIFDGHAGAGAAVAAANQLHHIIHVRTILFFYSISRSVWCM
jgi:serine/threonine protein phosphatase PrpC